MTTEARAHGTIADGALDAPDRSQEALKIARRLSEGTRHVHLHGPPGFGKRATVTALMEMLGARAVEVDLGQCDTASTAPLALLLNGVGGSSDEMHPEWTQAWHDIGDVLGGATEEGPVLVIVGADHLFLDHPEETVPNDVLAEIALVTVSLAPLHLICAGLSEAKTREISVELAAYPPGEEEEVDEYGDPIAEQDRSGGGTDLEAYLAEGESWFAAYLAKNGCDAEAERRLRRVFDMKFRARKDDVWFGHPFINTALLRRMLDARLAGRTVREANVEFRLELVERGPEMFGGALLPFTPGVEGAVALPAIEAIASACEALAAVRPLDTRQEDWLRAAGLADPDRDGGPPRWSSAARLLGDTSTPDGLEKVRTWALATRIAASRALRLRREKRLHTDRNFLRLLANVRAVFCETDRGLRYNVRVILHECRSLIVGRVYKFRLAQDFDEDVDDGSGDGTSQPIMRDVLVFETGAEGITYWRHQVRTLSMLGRMRHPSLATFERGGQLVPPDEVPGPSPPMYIEIAHGVDPLPRDDLNALIRRLNANALTDEGHDGPNPAFEQIMLLAEALDLIHAQGIVHRRLDFDALGIDERKSRQQLVLTGFEYSASLRSNMRTRRQRRFSTVRRSIWNLACQANETLGTEPRDLDPSVDVYAYGALAIMLATGLPTLEVLSEADALIPLEHEADNSAASDREMQGIETAAELLREDLKRDDRWADKGDDTARLRAKLESCLDPVPAERPSAEDLALSLREWHADYLARFEREVELLHASYPHDEMASSLKKMRLIDEDRNLDSVEGYAWLRNKIQSWVDEAKWMHFRESGFPRGGSAKADRARREAQFILAGPDVVFFASLFKENDNADKDFTCLWLAYVMRRDEITLPDPFDLDQTARATTEDISWAPKPKSVRVLQREHVRSTDRVNSWAPTLEILRHRGYGSEVARMGREAATVWRLHRDIVATDDAISRFPVFFEKARGVTLTYTMELDRERFQRLNETGAFGFLRRAILERTDPSAFFIDFVQQRIEGTRGSPQFSVNVREGASKGERLTATALTVEADNKVAVEFDDLTDTKVPKQAELFWLDSHGAQTAVRRQTEAIDRIERRTWLLDYLVDPRPCGRLMHEASGVGKEILGSASEGSKAALSTRVKTLLSSDPLHAVQGPPGTGKTTLIAALIAEVLDLRDGSRVLITSQNHAATDNVLLSVVQGLNAIAQREHGEDDGHTTVIRVFSETSRERVDSRVARGYSIGAQVRKAQARMAESVERVPQGQSDRLDSARRFLRKVSREGYLEIHFKIERNAPLVFSTTGAAMTSLDHLQRGMIGYDYALIDEAAKAWAIDLAQPMAIADRVILVGDQNQLPPFGGMELFRILDAAKNRREIDRLPPDVDALLSMSAEPKDKESPYVRMQGWLRPFHRLFEKCPPQTLLHQNDLDIPLTQSLNRQFRSVAAIGSLVSDTFYKDTVDIENAGPEPDLGRRVGIPTKDTGAELAPAVVWIDTSTRDSAEFRTRGGGSGGLWNRGEAKLIARLLRHVDLSAERVAGRDPIERLRLLSPYKAQVTFFKHAFRDEESSLGLPEAELERLFQTVDSSQGSEADTVVISLARRLEIALSDDENEASSAKVSVHMLKRRVDGMLGFLQQPERLNVMCSRARQQLVIVGDFDYYKAGAAALDAWKNLDAETEGKEYFWSRLIARFEDFDPVFHISDTGQERAVRVPVDQIAGLGG